jgi:hypothetical protein
MLLLLTASLAAEPVPAVASQAFVPRPVLRRPVLELRGGLDQTSTPQICGEVHPLPYVSVDACGTGSGWFHQRPTTEMSHYRLEADLPLARAGRLEAWLQPGVGFAEVQRDGDAAGYRFERAARAGQTEAAGPEATLSVRGRAWFHQHAYAVVELNGGIAHIPAAPHTVGIPSTLPSAALSVGVGL